MTATFKKKWGILYDYLKIYKKDALWGGLFMVLNVLMLLPTPLLTKYLIDTVIPSKNLEAVVVICTICKAANYVREITR